MASDVESFTWIPAQATQSQQNWWTPKPVPAFPTLPPSVPISQIQIIEVRKKQGSQQDGECNKTSLVTVK